jgi:predicted nuclease of predicted toxin-antitoxin system
MKIIIDESVPQKLRLLIEEDNTVVTVAFQGWSGMKNGDLLAAAEEAGFELFITADQEIRYQQNLAGRKLAVMMLSSNNWEYIKKSFHDIRAAIFDVEPDSYTEVEISE